MIKKWLSLIVPEYIILNLINITLFSIIITANVSSIGLLIPSIVSLSFVIIGFNSLNMYFDAELDKIGKPDRPLPKNQISKKNVLLFSISSYLLAIATALIFDTALLALVLLFVICSVLYTHPKFYFRKYLFSTNLFGAIFYSATPFLAAWIVAGKEFPIYFFALFFVLTAIIATSKEFEDNDAEKKFKIKSVVNTFGEKKIRNLMFIFMELALTTMLVLILAGLVEKIFLIPAFVALLAPILLKSGRQKEKEIITQGKFVTRSMLALVIIELLYALPFIVNCPKISF